MALTYTAIATVEVGSGGATSIEFTSIPQTYTDLCLKMSMRSDRGSSAYTFGRLTFNGTAYDTNWTRKELYTTGTSATSYSSTNSEGIWVDGPGATSNTFANGELYIPNYAGSNNKSMSLDQVGENNGTTCILVLTAMLWSNTAAITSLKVEAYAYGTNKFLQYSTATLYGIKNTV